MDTLRTRSGPLPYITIKLREGEEIGRLASYCVPGNYVFFQWEKDSEPDFVRKFEEELCVPCKPMLHDVSLATSSLVI